MYVNNPYVLVASRNAIENKAVKIKKNNLTQ